MVPSFGEIVASTDKRTRERVRLSVRVIEYAVNDDGRPAAAGTRYRLTGPP